MAKQESFKDRIKKNFSKNANAYDKYANIQKILAEKMSKLLPSRPIKNILDIGCGTGIFTKVLRDKYKTSHITAVDISPEMIEIAKKKMDKDVNFEVVDAEEIDDNNKQFDLIASNATLQWFRNLDKTLSKYKKMLAKDGIVMFSLFGPLTYHELAWAMEDITSKKILINSKKFLGKPEIETILKKYFKDVSVTEEIVKETNLSLRNLLSKIKYTGTQGTSMLGNGLLTREMLKKAEAQYKTKYKNLEATHQLFFCLGTV